MFVNCVCVSVCVLRFQVFFFLAGFSSTVCCKLSIVVSVDNMTVTTSLVNEILSQTNKLLIPVHRPRGSSLHHLAFP